MQLEVEEEGGLPFSGRGGRRECVSTFSSSLSFPFGRRGVRAAFCHVRRPTAAAAASAASLLHPASF